MSSYEKYPIANDARRAKRERKLGDNPICVLCGCDKFDALIPVQRSIIEKHHAVGRVNDDQLIVPLCRNCHGIVTETQLDMGIDMRHAQQRTFLEKLVDILLCCADFFRRLGDSFFNLAQQLIADIEKLTLVYPDWKTTLV